MPPKLMMHQLTFLYGYLRYVVKQPIGYTFGSIYDHIKL